MILRSADISVLLFLVGAGKTVKIVSVFIQILPMLKSDLCTVWLRDLYPRTPARF